MRNNFSSIRRENHAHRVSTPRRAESAAVIGFFATAKTPGHFQPRAAFRQPAGRHARHFDEARRFFEREDAADVVQVR